MSNIAVIKLAGSQHLVSPGDKFEVNRLDYEVEKDLSADVVLSTKGSDLLLNEGEVKIKVLEHKKGPKMHVVKFRAKSRYRRKMGHRQALSLVEVLSINGEKKGEKKSESKSVKAEAKVEVKKPVKKTTAKKPATKKAAPKKGSKK